MNYFLEELTDSLEAIAFKRDPLLFNELTAVFKQYRAGELVQSDLVKAVANSVKTHTKIQIKLIIEKGSEVTAYVLPPRIDANSPLLQQFSDSLREDNLELLTSTGITLVKKRAGELGWVNRDTGTVHGIFEQVISEMHITKGALDNDTLIPEELAAVVLHELGHVFTAFETLGMVVSTNFALATLADVVANTPDVPRRVQILKAAQRRIEFKDLDVDKTAALNKAETIVAVLLDSKVRAIRSQTGLSVYDENGWEFLSDQFATRQGAGRYLVTGLDKIHRAGGDQVYLGSVGRFFIYLFQITLNLIFIACSSGLWLIFIITIGFLGSPNGGTYDNTIDRFKRIRNDMVNNLKITDLDRDARSAILADIEAVDSITKGLKPFVGILDWLCINLWPKHKRELNQKTLEQELEKLATNDLFIKAAQFSNLT